MTQGNKMGTQKMLPLILNMTWPPFCSMMMAYSYNLVDSMFVAWAGHDELAAVSLIKDEPLVLVTSGGMSIKFDSAEVAPTSRTTSGIKGITLNKNDCVIAALPVRNGNDELAIFSANGLSKKFNLSELPIQKRAGKGLMCYKPSESTGDVVSAVLVDDTDNVLILGDKGSICISAQEIPSLSRASIGNQVIKNSKINSVSKV